MLQNAELTDALCRTGQVEAWLLCHPEKTAVWYTAAAGRNCSRRFMQRSMDRHVVSAAEQQRPMRTADTGTDTL